MALMIIKVPYYLCTLVGTEVQQAEREKDLCCMLRLALWIFTVSGAFIDHGQGEREELRKACLQSEAKKEGMDFCCSPTC